MMINIAKDFSITPGPRYKNEGPFSAEQFLNEIFRPRFQEALDNSESLTVNLDGTAGYATSFLEESFGGLQRENPDIKIEDFLKFVSDEEPYLIKEIDDYIKNARLQTA